MSALVDGMVAGYGIAIPIGAISVLLVSLAMERGLRAGLIAGIAIACVDMSFATMAVLAGNAILPYLTPYEDLLRWVSGITLIALGVYGMMKVLTRKEAKAGPELNERLIFLQFLALTALNPFTIVYFLALITGYGAGWDYSAQDMALFVLGVGLASVSWQTLLVYLAATARRFLSPRFLVATIVLGNIVVIALGAMVLLT